MNRLIALHWPSIRGRARADAGPLLLVLAVVAAICLLAGAVPPLLGTTADHAVRDAVRRAGDDAAVSVGTGFEQDYGPTSGRVRDPQMSAEVNDFRARAKAALAADLRAALQPPTTTVTTPSLAVTDGSIQRHLALAYVQNDGGGPAVTWVSGSAPKASSAADATAPLNGPQWPVQVGLSEGEAASLHARAGSLLPLEDGAQVKKNVRVSGVFRPADPSDPAWQQLPWVLNPVSGLDGEGSTRLGGLLSAASLPDARLAFDENDLTLTVSFAPDPARLTWGTAQKLAATVATLKAGSASSAEDEEGSLQWATQLDQVLRDVRDQVSAATAQASVLLIAVLAAAVLVLLLAAELLVRRRGRALIAARQRGGGLPDLAAELLVESSAVTIPGAAIGLALAWMLTGGASLAWAAPVIVGAVVATPALGTLAAARATRDRRQPANRTARRWQQRTRQLRRAAVEAAVFAATAGAVVALRQRGIGAGSDALPAAAPTLAVLTGTLILLRLMPGGTGLALRRALRSRRPLAVFSAARAADTARRALPLLALTTAAALAAFGATIDATTQRGLTDGAWHTVGADARLDITTDASGSTPTIARQIAAAPGVTHAVAAQLTDGAPVVADQTSVTVLLVVVDVAAYGKMLASTALPDPPDLSRLTSPRGAGVPALVLTADGSLRPGMNLQLFREDHAPLKLTAVGTAPPVDNAADVVIIDAPTAAAAGLKAVPDTVWATGPGAARAVERVTVSGRTSVRTEVLDSRRTAPLSSGLVRLVRASSLVLLILGVLGFALGAAASAPERWETLARLRTLGLRPRDTRRVAAGELFPPVVVAVIAGPLLGVLLAWVALGPLALRVLTGQISDPAVVLPWWRLGAVVVVVIAAAWVVTVGEAALRRRRKLSDVLRAGGD